MQQLCGAPARACACVAKTNDDLLVASYGDGCVPLLREAAMGDRAIAVCLSNCKLTAVTLPLYILRLGCQARPQADGTTLMRQGGEGTARSQAGAGA